MGIRKCDHTSLAATGVRWMNIAGIVWQIGMSTLIMLFLDRPCFRLLALHILMDNVFIVV